MHVKKIDHNKSETIGKALLCFTLGSVPLYVHESDVKHKHLRTAGLQGMNGTQYANTQTANH